MRKFVAGCLMGLLVFAALASVSLYFTWGYVQPVVSTVTGVVSDVSRFAEMADLDRALRNDAAFDPPAAGELTAEQVARFMRVQQQVRAALGQRGEAFSAKYRELSRRASDGAVVVPSLEDLRSGITDLSDVYLDAWRAQVAAMNAEGFSRDEFSWVRLRVYQAAGLDAVRYDARDLEHALERLARGARLEVPEVHLPDAPAANRALVKPHLTLITSWLGMAFFGL